MSELYSGLCHQHINPTGGIIFCLGDSGGPFDRKGNDMYERSAPLTALSALRPGIDIAIVPDGELEQAAATFYRQILGLESWQIQFAPGGFRTLETSVCGDMEARIYELARNGSFVLVTSYVHDAAEWLAERIQVPLYGDSWRWRKQYGKVALHSHIDPSKQHSPALDQLDGLTIPKGYVADTRAELMNAFSALVSAGNTKLVLKPAFADAGEGIIYLTKHDRRQIEEYDFKFGPAILEERIALAYDRELGGHVSPSIHWAGPFTGLPTSQMVEDTEYKGMCYPARLVEPLYVQAISMVRAYVEFSKPKGFGGVDFICDRDQRLFLCDVNNGRCTEAIPPLLFASQYGVTDQQVLLTRKYCPEDSIWALWSRLEAAGSAWHPGQSSGGVFPLMHLEEKTGMLVAQAPTVQEARALLRQATETF